MPNLRHPRHLSTADRLPMGVIAVACVFVVYAAFFIAKTSFVIGDVRYFSLFDDEMVSMRYAHNLADGNGLVMNPGERVEGFTNPVWTCIMAGVHLLPIPIEKTSLVIQIIGALILAATIIATGRLAYTLSGGDSGAATGAAIMTSAYLPLVNWSLQGTEVSLQALVAVVAMLMAHATMRRETFPWRLYLLCAAGTLIRLDMAVLYGGVLLFLALTTPRRERFRHLLRGALILAVVLGAQTLARYLYYGDILPNTYYLKMTEYPAGLRIARGLAVFGDFVMGMSPIVFLIPLAAIIPAAPPTAVAMALVILLQMLYSVHVGGDAWEDLGGANRYIAVVMPLFLTLWAVGARTLSRHAATHAGRWLRSDEASRTRMTTTFFIAAICLGVVQLNDNPGFLGPKGFRLEGSPPMVTNNAGMVRRALIVKELTSPDATVAVTWAGAIPYFSERRIVDILGKTDPVIARLPMRLPPASADPRRYFLPGHMKYDYARSIGELHPDAVLQFWGALDEADPFVAGRYIQVTVGDVHVYLRDGSPHVRWDLLRPATP